MTMSVKFEPELEQRLRQASRRQGRPASALIRDALSAYLASQAQAPLSAYDLGAELFGRHQGPTDLSNTRRSSAVEVWDAKDQARRR